MKGLGNSKKKEQKYYPVQEVTELIENKDISEINFADAKEIKHYFSSAQSPKMPRVLIVTEKPTVASQVAQALNYLSPNPVQYSNSVYTLTSNFMGIKSTLIVTSVSGHIYEKDFSSKIRHSSWESLDYKSMFDLPTYNLDKSSRNREIINTLKECSKNIDAVILWMDCDFEGENICFEVINIIKHNLRKRIILRPKFCSLAAADIRTAYKELQVVLPIPNINIYLAVDARRIIDLKLGVIFTRFLTSYINERYYIEHIVSYGPCQAPTLGFIVGQYKISQEESKKIHYYLSGSIEINKKIYQLKWKENDRNERESLTKLVGNSLKAEFVEIISKEKTIKKPLPLDTIGLLKLGIQELGIGCESVMRAAEHLYLNGLISYPRTDSSVYDDNEVKLFSEKSKLFKEFEIYPKEVQNIIKHIDPCLEGKNKYAHSPITPNLVDDETFDNKYYNLRHDEKKLYNVIVCHYLSTFSHSYTYIKKKARFNIGDETFYLKGIECKKLGFSQLMKHVQKVNIDLPSIRNKTYYANIDIRKRIYPLQSISEINLIEKMALHEIGTDASISTHIKNIIDRKYGKVVVDENHVRRIEPTKLGIALYDTWFTIDKEIVLPIVRQNIEMWVKMIADGKAKHDDIIINAMESYKKKFINLEKNIAKLDEYIDLYQV